MLSCFLSGRAVSSRFTSALGPKFASEVIPKVPASQPLQEGRLPKKHLSPFISKYRKEKEKRKSFQQSLGLTSPLSVRSVQQRCTTLSSDPHLTSSVLPNYFLYFRALYQQIQSSVLDRFQSQLCIWLFTPTQPQRTQK